MMTNHDAAWDLVVVGAGAAGMLAAARSAERGLRTLILEKNRKPGVKILMSGGTRCNITHDCDARGIIAAFGRDGAFLHSALASFSPRDVVDYFHREGVSTKVEPGGKVFPTSDRALDVRDAMLRRLTRSGAVISLGEPVREVNRTGEGFEMTTPTRGIRSRQLLVTTGGQSYPGCGTTGDGYRWLAEMGHRIVTPRPALVPILLQSAWTRELAGITVSSVRVGVWESVSSNQPKSKPLLEYTGSFLFTHKGVSGPVALDVSKAVSKNEAPERLVLRCDFLPDWSLRDTETEIQRRCATSGKRRADLLFPELPHRLVEAIFANAGIHPERNAAELSKLERQHVIQGLKSSMLPIQGTLGFEKAEVTTGGAALEEVHSKTLGSKLGPGLFLAGEVLDLDGRIGGYNFQSAFSTGWLAASHATSAP
jgi:hypothetical protein